VYDERSQRAQVEQWVNGQVACPSRKQTVKAFPEVPQRIIRAAIQSRKDKDRKGAQP
jgi:hypothetical protein